MESPIPNSQRAAAAQGIYTYMILRYVHDVGTAEFINVGVVVAMSNAPRVAARFTSTSTRVKSAFPSLDCEIFLARMTRLQACFDAIDEARCAEIRDREGQSITALLRCVLPLEDSALHWSPVGSGTGDSLSAILLALYERFVGIHDLQPGRARASRPSW